MPLHLDAALGIHPQALRLRAQRARVLSSNLANADTPGFLARDFDFHQVLAAQRGTAGGTLGLRVTHPAHLGAAAPAPLPRLQYRVPDQPALDGNTVDAQREKAAFTENALGYLASLNFLNGRIRGLIGALRGE